MATSTISTFSIRQLPRCNVKKCMQDSTHTLKKYRENDRQCVLLKNQQKEMHEHADNDNKIVKSGQQQIIIIEKYSISERTFIYKWANVLS